jgi:hypothetical protein
MVSGGTPNINTTGEIQATNMAGTITLSPGVYKAALTTDSTALKFNVPQSGPYNMGSLAWRQNRFPPSVARSGKATASSGSYTTINFGSSLGAITADNDYQLAPAFRLWKE